tara:strand:+ start:6114 stop:7712 length:1599 start_codon:yes stop_codon:yes gene_type:complete
MRIITLVIAVFLGLMADGTRDSYMEDQRALNLIGAGDETESVGFTPFWLLACHAGATILAGLGFLSVLVLGKRNWGQVLALTLVCLGIALAWLPSDLVSNVSNLELSKVGEDPAPWTYFVKLVLIAFLVLSPPILLWAYYAGPILDRYVIRGVVSPLALSFLGLVGIWVIMDLTDNGKVFFTEEGFSLLGRYYLVQLPQIVLLVLPITLLLSLLFSLGKMSKSNELISMLGAGLSMGRVLKPLFVAGFYCTLLCIVLNYDWAPRAEAHKEGILNRLQDALNDKEKGRERKKSGEDEWAALAWMYRNSMDQRTWFVGRVPVDLANAPMRYVAVWAQADDNRVMYTIRADSAYWNHQTKVWTFRKARIWEYDIHGTPKVSFFPILTKEDWNETPWHVVSSSYKAEFLGIPGLTSYLRTNRELPPNKLAPYWTHWHYSWAEPFRCFFIVLMAAPLGIVHSRKGILGGVTASILIFFALIFFDSVFLALAEGARLKSWVGAWGPNIGLGVIGAILFWARANNKELPKFKNLFSKTA